MTDYIEEIKNRNKKLKEMIESSKEELEELKKKKSEIIRGIEGYSIICDEPRIGRASFETVITETVFPIKIQLEDGEIKITKDHIKFILQQYENSKKESLWKRTWKSILRILRIA